MMVSAFPFEPALITVVPPRYELPLTSSLLVGVVVPIPTFPPKYAIPVVVAPPETVRPPACVPLPIVEDAVAMRPWVMMRRVEVELPSVPGVHGKAKF